MKRVQQALWIVYFTWAGIGTVLLALHSLPPWLGWSRPFFLWLCGIVGAVLLSRQLGTTRGVLSTLWLGALGFTAECIGVHTGFPFGSYRYTTVLGPQWLGVPWVIAAAWIFVLSCSLAFAPRRRGRLAAAMMASLLAVALDALLDPVSAVVLHEWVWTTPGSYFGVPWQNFAAWFVLGTIGLYPLVRLSVQRDVARQALAAVAALFVLFAIQAGERQWWIPIAIACVAWWIAGFTHLRTTRREPL